MLLTEYRKIESSALLSQIVEDEYDSYSKKKQQWFTALKSDASQQS